MIVDKSYFGYNQLIHFRYQNSIRKLKSLFEKYNQDLYQSFISTNKSQIEN